MLQEQQQKKAVSFPNKEFLFSCIADFLSLFIYIKGIEEHIQE